jgi:hypothetical protein
MLSVSAYGNVIVSQYNIKGWQRKPDVLLYIFVHISQFHMLHYSVHGELTERHCYNTLEVRFQC